MFSLSRLFPRSPRDSIPDDASDKSFQATEFFPSVFDVLKVRFLLQWKLKEGLPVELIDAIIDEAEYWPSTECHMEDETRRVIHKDRDQVLMKTVPLCFDRAILQQSESPSALPHRSEHPCRKIVFQLASHDQGGGGTRGGDMYNESWTWFDTEVIHNAHTLGMYSENTENEILDNERGQIEKSYAPDDELLLPRGNKLQVNRVRSNETHNVNITWSYLDSVHPDSDEAFGIERSQGRGRLTLDGHGVREMKIGDSIAVWARARFPGWSNYVYSASVRVFWAI
ncbi:hypothetical protein N7495_002911 [Penicillium taxi]|uniref:uncharacterized protein n=1 Tax=Penicillium taxi TaxID=168475 RepID=UPI00254525A3|nr:uncharacterized protein N7495_002911 [Penicillium taxi]KAJ5902383.1 hypothetical protein N7495_002911 [Penicillium taxi]